MRRCMFAVLLLSNYLGRVTQSIHPCITVLFVGKAKNLGTKLENISHLLCDTTHSKKLRGGALYISNASLCVIKLLNFFFVAHFI